MSSFLSILISYYLFSRKVKTNEVYLIPFVFKYKKHVAQREREEKISLDLSI